jgi:alkylated DNA repair dioxygenase AlkB
VLFRSKTYVKTLRPWTDVPPLIETKAIIERLVGIDLNVCIIQKYANNSIGIKRHRDKEMTPGTSICGVSLGQKRILRISPPTFLHTESFDINLNHGSLYVLKPPTNDYWFHEIPPQVQESDGVRYSLTFRNYKAPQRGEL